MIFRVMCHQSVEAKFWRGRDCGSQFRMRSVEVSGVDRQRAGTNEVPVRRDAESRDVQSMAIGRYQAAARQSARIRGVPIIAIPPNGARRIPKAVTRIGCSIVGWCRASVIRAAGGRVDRVHGKSAVGPSDRGGQRWLPPSVA